MQVGVLNLASTCSSEASTYAKKKKKERERESSRVFEYGCTHKSDSES